MIGHQRNRVAGDLTEWARSMKEPSELGQWRNSVTKGYRVSSVTTAGWSSVEDVTEWTRHELQMTSTKDNTECRHMTWINSPLKTKIQSLKYFTNVMNKKLWNHVCLLAFYLTFHLKHYKNLGALLQPENPKLTLNWKLQYFNKLAALMAATKVPGAITASTGRLQRCCCIQKTYITRWWLHLQHWMATNKRPGAHTASTGQELSWLLLHTSERSPFVASSPAPQITALTEPDSATGLSQTNCNLPT